MAGSSGRLGLGVLAGPLDELAVGEGRSGPHERDQVRGALASARTSDGRAAMLTPMLKNVAGTLYRASTAKMAAVLAPGPSSNVSATVFPLPDA